MFESFNSLLYWQPLALVDIPSTDIHVPVSNTCTSYVTSCDWGIPALDLMGTRVMACFEWNTIDYTPPIIPDPYDISQMVMVCVIMRSHLNLYTLIVGLLKSLFVCMLDNASQLRIKNNIKTAKNGDLFLSPFVFLMLALNDDNVLS